MNKHTYKVREFYEKSTEVYFKLTGGYIHGYATSDEFNIGKYFLEKKIIKEGDLILDAGCGMGKVAIDIVQNIPLTHVIGLTISPKQIEIGHKLISEANLNNKIKLLIGDFHHLKTLFPQQKFDVLIFNESLFHANNVKQVLEQAFYVLKPGGVLYSKDIYRNSFTFNPFLNLKILKITNMISKNYHYIPQYKKNIEKFAINAGFKIISFDMPSYNADFNKTIEFEKKFGLNTYRYIAKTHATHWRELICKKNE